MRRTNRTIIATCGSLAVIGLATLLCLTCKTPAHREFVAEDPLPTPTPETSEDTDSDSTSPVIRFPDGNVKIQRTFKSDSSGKPVLHGPYVEFYNSGQKKLEGNYFEGKRHRLFTTWNEQGVVILKRTFDKGLEDGTYTAWDDLGRKTWEVTYRSGKPFGRFTSYHPNGQKRGEGTCINGKKHGLYTVWNADGQIVRTVFYNHGLLIED